jgi:hypothetical protein
LLRLRTRIPFLLFSLSDKKKKNGLRLDVLQRDEARSYADTGCDGQRLAERREWRFKVGIVERRVEEHQSDCGSGQPRKSEEGSSHPPKRTYSLPLVQLCKGCGGLRSCVAGVAGVAST